MNDYNMVNAIEKSCCKEVELVSQNPFGGDIWYITGDIQKLLSLQKNHSVKHLTERVLNSFTAINSFEKNFKFTTAMRRRRFSGCFSYIAFHVPMRHNNSAVYHINESSNMSLRYRPIQGRYSIIPIKICGS